MTNGTHASAVPPVTAQPHTVQRAQVRVARRGAERHARGGDRGDVGLAVGRQLEATAHLVALQRTRDPVDRARNTRDPPAMGPTTVRHGACRGRH